jgi:hypothetical protein
MPLGFIHVLIVHIVEVPRRIGYLSQLCTILLISKTKTDIEVPGSLHVCGTSYPLACHPACLSACLPPFRLSYPSITDASHAAVL